MATLLVVFMVYPTFAQSDLKNSKDHALISRLPDTHITAYHVSEYQEFSIATGPITREILEEQGKTALPPVKTFEGKVSVVTYKANKKSLSALAIYRNYEKAFKSNGFETVFSCKGDKECGVRFVPQLYWYGDPTRRGQNKGLNAPNTSDRRYTYYYWSGVAKAEDGNFIVSLLVAQNTASIFPAVIVLDVNQVEALDDNHISINLEGMNDDISKTGKVVLDGIFFDFDKSNLKAESNEAINTIAQYLDDNVDNNFYVVGHTDNKGSLDYNLKLSTSRATSVVKELVSKYNIDPKRLLSSGVGPVSPETSNDTENGRVLNRRVEMVLQD